MGLGQPAIRGGVLSTTSDVKIPLALQWTAAGVGQASSRPIIAVPLMICRCCCREIKPVIVQPPALGSRVLSAAGTQPAQKMVKFPAHRLTST